MRKQPWTLPRGRPKFWAWVGRAKPEWITAAMTFVIAVTTCYYAFVSSRQWHAMLDSNNLTRKALDSNERAWLMGSILVPTRQPDGHFTFALTIKNVGKSPAFHVKLSPDFTFDGAPPSEARIDMAGGDTSIEPGQSLGGTTNTNAQVEAAIKEKRSFYAWLLILYSDPFGDRRFTRECFLYVPQPRPGMAACSTNIVHR